MNPTTSLTSNTSYSTLEAHKQACYTRWDDDRKAAPTYLPPLSQVNGLITDRRSSATGWHIKALKFPTGDVELMAVYLTGEDRLKSGGGAKRENKEKSQMDETVIRKSQYRAKKTVRHKLLTMGTDRMLTLTYRENITDLERAWKDFHAFNRKMKKRYKERWQYVCVPEFQKRGAVHFHLAIKGWLNVNVVRRLWRDVVGQGNIDITPPSKYKLRHTKRTNTSWNPKKIANYLAKYITKKDAVAFNKRRYTSSKIELPEPVIGWVAAGMDMFHFLYRLTEKLTHKSMGEHEYFEYDGYFKIAKLST